ncbi:hypothetical protein NYE69_16445 [Paenibacillus sp. FSL R5-0527]|uniref:hypothetical protein n=1 Tax=Paenibacillus sp. FSL R5-0527 TaxID=2975321 RepID=UPI0026B043F7
MMLKETLQHFLQQHYPGAYQVNTEQVDFSAAERELGFTLHPELQEYYGSFYFVELEGVIDESQVPPTDQWENWFEFNKEFKLHIALQGLDPSQTMSEQLMYNYTAWTGGNDFGQRIWIGSIYANIGEILLVFNNQTGAVEWIDTEYGNFGDLQQDPNGMLTHSITELIQALKAIKL